MILTTTDEVPGRKVLRILGIARGSTIRSRDIARSFLARLRGTVGGEIPEFTKLIAEAREQALDRLKEEAWRMGANAVLGLRFTTSEVMHGAAEVMVYGTAAVLEEEAR